MVSNLHYNSEYETGGYFSGHEGAKEPPRNVVVRGASTSNSDNSRSDNGNAVSYILKKVAFIAILMAVIFSSLIALKFYSPISYYRIISTLEFMELGRDSKQEYQRLSAIELLPISDEKKMYIREHRIFMGASPYMVELALGEPISKTTGYSKHQKNRIVQKWTYHLDGEGRPTVLEFDRDSLISAYKVSAYDIGVYMRH